MSQLKRNLLANYLGQAWTAVMGVAFIPLYIRHLGMEAYGLIGLFAVMYAWLTLLDLGMTPTLNREMARYTAGARDAQSIADLLRSLEMLCFTLAAFIGVIVWAASDYMAGHWLQAERLPRETVAQALAVIALVISLRFIEGIYRGALFGLQRQVWFNCASALLATIRYGGAVMVLAWVAPTIQAFFLWQAFVSLLTLVAFGSSVHWSMPRPPVPAKFSLESLAEIGKFAGGMMGITFLVLLLTQVDKVLLSRLVSLESFGYYTLAATVAGIVYLAVAPITQAFYPRMVELATRGDQVALGSLYHEGAQLVSVLAAPGVMLLAFFAEGVVYVWSGDAALAQSTAPILAMLVLGTYLNGLMWMPYQCQLAHGWTSLTIKTNTIAVAVLVPALLWVVPRYGAVGAAWIWLILNAGYVLVTIQFMHRRVIPGEKWRWYWADVLLPTAGAVGVLSVVRLFQPDVAGDRGHWLLFLLVAGCLALVASVLLADRIRSPLLRTVGRLFS